MNVQSYISNIAFPTTLEELYEFAGLFNMEMVLGCGQFNDYGNNISRYNSWTAPKWIQKDDIVFFMHAKYNVCINNSGAKSMTLTTYFHSVK